MNVSAIERMADDLRRQAVAVEAIGAGVQRIVSEAQQIWSGHNAGQFERLGERHRRVLRSLAHDLDDLGQLAAANARAQVRHSGHLPGGGTREPTIRTVDFGRQMQGKEHHREDRDMAVLAQAVYTGSDAGHYRAEQIIDLPDGFQAVLYRDDGGTADTDDDRVVLAFAGTNPTSIEDWVNNAGQLAGLSSQHAEAMALAVALHHTYGDRLVFTGHSLGGGLASAAAIATGCPAVTFNAAGLSPTTVAQASLLRGRFPWEGSTAYRELAAGQVRNYTTYGDVLTTSQESLGPLAPDALGAPIGLNSRPPGEGQDAAVWAVGEHGMDHVITALDEQFADPGSGRPDASGH